MVPYILVISLLFIIIIVLFYANNSKNEIETKIDTPLTGKPCPLCSTLLQKNERVHSIVYRGEDTIMHIYGCPYCYEDHPKSKFKVETQRVCHACNKPISKKEYVIARLFEKPGKNHVHVLGCYRCRGKR